MKRPAGVVLRAALCAAFVSGACLTGSQPPEGPLTIDRPLIAYWTFDELMGTDCRDQSGNGYAAASRRTPGLQRIRGVFGNAMVFSGAHMLSVPEKPDFGRMQQIAFSAWTLPTDLSIFREIFRKEDGDNRVLFSFQGDGAILSLGLNIGGYVECDAAVDPARVLDGDWHHCAASFDGETMRVYLDGEEVGSLDRPGEVIAEGLAPGCIGSSNGGENFQGAMDDLRIYGEALSAEDVAALHQNGREALARLTQGLAADEPEVGEPLAHWTFNEPGLVRVMREASGNEALDVTSESALVRTRGVHGSALDLSGEHALAVPPPFGEQEPAGIGFSAWTRPTDLSGHREIFRREAGEGRLLFSYQESGSVLSFGLNIGGYKECDASIAPEQVLDGQWHHCAASFDGKVMRVYLDGEEIGSEDRPGVVRTDPAVTGFIGSSGGETEHFQGGLDDLRLYDRALSAGDVGRLYRGGREAVERFAAELRGRLDAFYSAEDTFAETLANARRRLHDGGIALDSDMAAVLAADLRKHFPEEYGKFDGWTGAGAVAYLTDPDGQFQQHHATRLVELMLEYRPLTKPQRAKQTDEDRRRWAEAQTVAERLAGLLSAGESARFSPEWIDLLLEAGSRVTFRPYRSEPVAPYITPETPETRDFTTEEARDALERDWLHQCGGDPSPERIRQEIAWARELADRIDGDFGEELTELAELEAKLDGGPDASHAAPPSGSAAADAALYFAVREVKRRIQFANPVVDFEKVLLVDMPFPQGSEWPHETRHRLGYMAVPGGRLLVLDGLSPGGKLTQLMPQEPLHGSFWRPDVSWDGERVVFCFKPHNEKSFHLYEIGADGTGLKQLTDGIYDDFDPIYLPDGEHIMFSTTRAHTYVRCMPPTNAYVLARCDRDGKNVYLVSSNNEPDYLPSVMNDGRVIYTRWEYTDKPLWRAMALWTVSPDGTHVSTFWGNQSVWPDLIKDARSIPGSKRVMVTGSAHHDWFSGSVGIIDPDRGFNFPDGITKVTADTAWPEVGNGPSDPVESPRYHSSGNYSAYYSPYPLSERDFLVSANRSGKFVLYLMDTDGNRELVYEGVNNILHAMPLKPRKRPPVIADSVDWPARGEKPADGVIYSANVYEGAPDELRGKAKFLRVLSIDPKTYTYWHKRPYASTGPVVSMVQSEGVKRVMGTVPIEDDGSVSFNAPPGTPLHFQLLDGEYRALQTMRSFVGLMPGEKRGCQGCHELHSKAPEYGGQGAALVKEPLDITPPPWGEDTVGYDRYVQPVLDKYCGKCHQNGGKGQETLDLTRRPGYLMFPEPYVTLTGRPTWGAPYTKPEDPPPGFGIASTLMVEGYATTDPEAYVTPAPMTALSYKSKLIDIASSGEHHGVKVDEISRRKLIAWVDTMCPLRGDEEVREIEDPVFQGVDWLAIRPRIATAPRIVRPGPVD